MTDIAVSIQDTGYNKYKDGIVLKWAKILYTQIILKIHDPKINMIVGTMVFPSPLKAAIVASINEEIKYEHPITTNLFIPASTTSLSLENKDKKFLPKRTNNNPKTRPIKQE